MFETVFATPPHLFLNYEGDLTDVLKYVKGIDYKTSKTNQSSLNTFIINEPEIKDLKLFFYHSLRTYVNKVFEYDHEYSITQSWINKSGRGGSHTVHNHPNSVVSGVFYLQSDESTGDIVFCRPGGFNEYQVNPDCVNMFLTDNYTCPPKTGRLILFPSNIPHYVMPNDSDVERYSLSFNSFPFLPIGSQENLTLLA
jgi:uncharacterized protein (TIGR02466 family)